ncbi:MAG: hypothetical protein GXP42_04385, partial [Chloroflexi bacterium]|nr:hypothetical protein [Chloroflexota bacterium]
LERETVTQADLEDILGPRPPGSRTIAILPQTSATVNSQQSAANKTTNNQQPTVNGQP